MAVPHTYADNHTKRGSIDPEFMRNLFLNIFWRPTDHTFVQLIRYGMVAAFGLIIDVGGLVLLKELAHWHYLWAATASFLAGLVVNYFLSTWWIFTNSRFSSRWHDFLLFGLIGLVGLGINALLMWALTSGLGWYYLVSKAVSTGIVFIWNFTGRKLMYRQ